MHFHRLLTYGCLFCCTLSIAQQVFSKKATLMGVDFEFAVVAVSKEKAAYYLDEAYNEVIRVENVISSWKSHTQTHTINSNAGLQAVKVDKELWSLIFRSKRISNLTDGYFDISFASIDKIWYFHKELTEIPDSLRIRKSVEKIDYKKIILDKESQSVFLKEKGMKIGFGAIGKGYVAEKVKQKLESLGVKAGLVNASGDIRCWGDHPVTKTWKIAITNPKKDASPLAWFELHNAAVVTSGNYEKFASINGKKYTHIINPKTGWPVKGLQSVTIFCNNAELADALATAVFVMGKEKGLGMINQLKGIECLLVDDNDAIFYSNTLKTKVTYEN